MNIATLSDAKRPGRPKSSEKADAIREAAACLFMTEGMGRTSMDAIAQAAGVSKQTVYSHFKSKDDLFRACIVSKVQMYGLDESQFDATVPLDEGLRRVGIQFLTLLSDPEVVQMFRLMIAEATTFPRVAQTFHETGPRATTDYVTTILAHYLRCDRDAPVAQQATRDFLSLVKGDFLIERLLGTRDPISDSQAEAHVDRCIDVIKTVYELDDSA